MGKETINNIREWINTVAALIAITAGIYGFSTLKSDNERFERQLKQTTKIAVAADIQVQELAKHTKILEDQYILNVEEMKINKSRYVEETSPYFAFEYAETVQETADINGIVNIGNKAKITYIEYGKENDFTVDFSKNIYFQKGENGYIEIKRPPIKKPKMDFTIYIETINRTKYKQRFFSDKEGKIITDRPVRIN